MADGSTNLNQQQKIGNPKSPAAQVKGLFSFQISDKNAKASLRKPAKSTAGMTACTLRSSAWYQGNRRSLWQPGEP
jgi:hypothetical protein